MNIPIEDVKRVAQLAQIGIDDAQAQALTHDLARILDLIEQIHQADTINVEPMAHPNAAKQRVRADEITEHDHRDEYHSIAPVSTLAGLYLVPPVIEHQEN